MNIFTKIITIQSSIEVNGEPNFTMVHYFDNDTSGLDETIVSRGNDVFVKCVDDVLVKVAQHSYVGGEHWVTAMINYRCFYYGQISVPAGTFDSCFAIEKSTHYADTIFDTLVFAPDIGMVYDSQNNSYNYSKRYVLTNKNIH